jgi:signal peptidase I
MCGDRDSPLDSRYWEFVPRENIIGKPLIIYLLVLRRGRPGIVDPDDRRRPPGRPVGALLHQDGWRRTFMLVHGIDVN